MPIGFWAISRKEVIDMWQALTGDSESTPGFHDHINQIIRNLPGALEQTLYRTIITEKNKLYKL